MNRILIIRPSAIGDIVMAAPMIRSLRQAYPRSHIAWMADPVAAELLQDHPALNEVIWWSKAQWRLLARSGRIGQLWTEVRKFRNRLREKQFDTVLDIQGLFRSRLLAWLTGAEQRIGFDSREPGKWLMTRILSKGPSNKVMGGEYLYLLQTLGVAPAVNQAAIELSEAIRSRAAQRATAEGVVSPYIALCPFTTRPQKHWDDERWARLAQMLWQRHRMPGVLLGGAGDSPHSYRLQALAESPLYSLTGKTSLGESAAIVQAADLVIGVDTGLTHLGTTFLRPTVALFGATCPYLSTANPLTRIVYHRLACSPCKRKPTCDGRYDCMKAITADAVFDTSHKLLQQAAAAPHANSPH